MALRLVLVLLLVLEVTGKFENENEDEDENEPFPTRASLLTTAPLRKTGHQMSCHVAWKLSSGGK